MKNPTNKTLLKIAVIAVISCLTVIYFHNITGFIGMVLNVCFPMILGCMLAFVLNIPLRFLEKRYFPRSTRPWVIRSRRPVCIILAFVILLGILLLLLLLVTPEMIGSFQFFGQALPPLFEQARAALIPFFDDIPSIQNMLTSLDIDWKALFASVSSTFMSGAGGALSSIMTTILEIVNGFIQTFVALIFAVYLLAGKEKLKRQADTLLRAYLKPHWREKLLSILRLSNRTFSNYFAGQCIEAIIFGLLCFAGMLLFQLPYAVPISILLGVTALVPMIGAFIGIVLGSLMILTVSPLQMLFFLLLILVLQQIEGNLIFPKVVGTAINLPGLWTLVAVTLGGGLLGILGIFICVPATSVIYQLLRKHALSRPQLLESQDSDN